MKKSMYRVKCWLILKRVGSNHLPMDTRQTDLSLIGSSIQARRRLIYPKIESKLLVLVALLSMCQKVAVRSLPPGSQHAVPDSPIDDC